MPAPPHLRSPAPKEDKGDGSEAYSPAGPPKSFEPASGASSFAGGEIRRARQRTANLRAEQRVPQERERETHSYRVSAPVAAERPIPPFFLA